MAGATELNRNAVFRLFFTWWVTAVPTSLNMIVVYLQNLELRTVKIEVKNGMYSPMAYCIANTITQLPFMFGLAICAMIPAFGIGGFFSHPWFVVDLFAVSVSAVFELNEELLGDHCKVFCFGRLWKVAAFAFDVALVEHEASELRVEEKNE